MSAVPHHSSFQDLHVFTSSELLPTVQAPRCIVIFEHAIFFGEIYVLYIADVVFSLHIY